MNYIHNNSIDEKIRIENEKFNHNWIQLNKFNCYQSISKDHLDFDNFDSTVFMFNPFGLKTMEKFFF